MTDYAFPRDLLDAIKTRWQTVPDQQFELPEVQILQRLLETCYHASFRTSEGPGALTISQGRTSLVRLRDGQIVFPQENLFQSVQNPLGVCGYQ